MHACMSLAVYSKTSLNSRTGTCVCVCVCARACMHAFARRRRENAGTQYTCFSSTKGPILTFKELQGKKVQVRRNRKSQRLCQGLRVVNTNYQLTIRCSHSFIKGSQVGRQGRQVAKAASQLLLDWCFEASTFVLVKQVNWQTNCSCFRTSTLSHICVCLHICTFVLVKQVKQRPLRKKYMLSYLRTQPYARLSAYTTMENTCDIQTSNEETQQYEDTYLVV